MRYLLWDQSMFYFYHWYFQYSFENQAPLDFIYQCYIFTVTWFNSLAPGRFQRNFRKVIFQLTLAINGWSISCKILHKWMPMDLTDGKSTLVQVMVWCSQATSHYLNQCWPRSLPPYGITRPQLELECLHSEDTPRRLMITHTIDSYWIPSQNKTKSKLQI